MNYKTEQMDAFPTLEERLKEVYYPFTVYDHPPQEGYREGVYYHGIDKGKSESDEMKPVDEWLSSPLRVIANTKDEDGNAGKLIELHRTDEPIKEFMNIPKEAITKTYDPPVFSLLSKRSVEFNEKQKKLLIRFLKQPTFNLTILSNRTGWKDDDSFVLPDKCIGGDKYLMPFNHNKYTSKGTLDQWTNSIGKLSKHNPMVQLAIMAGFAGALLKPTGVMGGGLHFFGASGKGKTTLLQAGASIWGNGKDYPISWRASANGLEQNALMHNDTLLALDELAETEVRTANDMIYSLSNGYPKARATVKNGEVSAFITNPWRVFTISTGEDSISTFFKRTSFTQKAGQAVRFLDIPATSREHGVFDDLKGFESASQLAEEMTRASTTYYGTAGRAFLQYLMDNKSDIKTLFNKTREAVEIHAIGTEEKRASKLFSLLCLAGELAITAGILPWDKDEPLKAVIKAFKLWQKERGFIGENLSKGQVLISFRNKTLTEPYLFESNNRADDNHINLQQVIGWVVNTSTGDEYIFLPENLALITDNKVSKDETADAFYSINALIHDEGRKTTKRIIKGENKRARVYVVNANIVYDYLEKQENLQDSMEDF